MSQREPNIIHLKIDKNHLVRTGFMEHFNELLLTTVYNAYVDTDTGLFTLQREKGDITIPFTLTGLSDVDLTNTTAGQILSYDGSNWVNIDGGGVFNYVRNKQSNRFTDITSVTSIVDALDKILYPYTPPTFTSFSISGVSSTLELGQTITPTLGGNKTFQWGVSTIDNISNTDGYVITDTTNSVTLLTNILPKTLTSQVVNIPYGVVKTTNNATHSFRIQGKNTENNFFNRTVTYTWQPRIFWGSSPKSTTLTDGEIEGLSSNKLTNTIAQTFTMNGNGQYLWIVMPQSFGLAIEADGSNSRFVVGGLANSGWELFTTTYTNSYGHSEPYYLYRSTTIQFGTGLSIKIV